MSGYPDEMGMHVPPHNIDAEQSVLGGLMLDANAWDFIAGKVVESDFYRGDHRLIFRSIEHLVEENKPLDFITLSDWLAGQGLLNEAGGKAYLGTLAKDVPSAANIRAYADIVREKSNLRQLVALVTNVQAQVYEQQHIKADVLIAKFEQDVFELSERSMTGKQEVIHVKPALRDLVGYMRDVSTLSADELLGTATGIDQLDVFTEGYQGGDLVIVAGRPSMGKTVFGGCAERAVSESGAVLSFTLEMPVRQLVMRHVSAMSGVPLQRVKKSMTMTEDDWSMATIRAFKPLNDRPLFYVNKPGITISEVVAYARRVHRDHSREHGCGLKLITIDYVQLMGTEGGSGNRSEDLGNISRRLKQLALELDCTVMLLSQLNRSLESRPSKRPVMSDLRESGALEQDADMIIFLYRDEVYNPDTPDKGIIELIVAKQRQGELGTVRAVAQLDRARIVNYVPDIEEPFGGR